MPARPGTLLRFLRVPAAPTAPADVAAGFALSGGDADSLLRVTLAAGASLFLYLGGMGLNDVCDRAHDAIHRPGRPIPSGELPLPAAATIVALLFATALVLAALAGGRVLAVVLLLAVLVVGYDAGGKGVAVLGPLLMAGCRALNLLLGGAAAGSWLEPPLPLLHGLYSAGLTAGAVHEEGRSVPRRFIAFALMNLAAPLAAAALVPRQWNALPFAAVLSVVLASAAVRVVRSRSPKDVQGWVRIGVVGFLLYDASLLAGAGRWLPSLVAAALLPACLALGRRYPPS
jgi:hypothetical protein